MYENITVKAFLDIGVMGIFMDKKTTEKHSFKLQKLERLLIVKNMKKTRNSKGNIMY